MSEHELIEQELIAGILSIIRNDAFTDSDDETLLRIPIGSVKEIIQLITNHNREKAVEAVESVPTHTPFDDGTLYGSTSEYINKTVLLNRLNKALGGSDTTS